MRVARLEKPDAIVWKGDPSLPRTFQGIHVLGAPVGSPEYVADQMEKKSDKQETLFTRISRVQDTQAATSNSSNNSGCEMASPSSHPLSDVSCVLAGDSIHGHPYEMKKHVLSQSTCAVTPHYGPLKQLTQHTCGRRPPHEYWAPSRLLRGSEKGQAGRRDGFRSSACQLGTPPHSPCLFCAASEQWNFLPRTCTSQLTQERACLA